MRVISGTAKGTKLISPQGLSTRPTTDRIKETLFNIIAFDLMGSTFLDLFSGSGAIGIEALSRGAKSAVFVDKSRDCISVIKDNLSKTHLSHNANIICDDVNAAIHKLFGDKMKFDFIFMDAPYDTDLTYITLEELSKFNLLNDGGVIITETSTSIDFSKCNLGNIELYREKIISSTKFSFFSNVSDADS